MPRDLLANISAPARPPRDLFADGGSAPAAPQNAVPSVVDTIMRGNPLTSGLAQGFDALPDWLRGALGRDASRVGNSLADAIQLPMDTLTNKDGINNPQIDPTTGQPQSVSDSMLQRSSNAAGWMTGGELTGGKPTVTTAAGAAVPRKLIDAIMRDQVPVADTAARVADLGPAATVADIGDNTQKLAAAVATQPGAAGAQITTAMKARSKDSTARVPAAVNHVLGPATPPSEIKADIKVNKQAVGPEYDAALAGAGRVHLDTMARDLDAQIATLKGPALADAQAVRSMLNVNGANASDLSAKLETSASALFNVRNAIDKMMKDPKADTATLTPIREQVDAILEAAAPGIKNIDAKYRELARQGDALDAGATVLDAGKTAVWPQENAAAVAAGVQPEGKLVGPSAAAFRLSQGARADIERIVGTKKNDRVALANLIGGESDWNPQKLAQLFGQDRADKIMQVVQSERQMAETENLAVNGSKTAAVTAAQQDLNGTPVQPSAVQGRTLVDIAMAVGDKLTAGATAARRAETAKAIADAILSKGDFRTTPGRPATHIPLPMESILAAVNGAGQPKRELKT